MKPKLRPVEAHPIQHQGKPMVLLRDPLRLSEATIAVPQPLGPLLVLMDGTRDGAELEAALMIRAGVRLAPGLLERLVADLDEAYLLDNRRFADAKEFVLQAYREAPFRPLGLDTASFPHRSDLAAARLQGYVAALALGESPADGAPAKGLVSPHIDFERGGSVYAQVWQAAAETVREADLVIMLGTDHQGSDGALTLTRQSYATPWGVLPTDLDVVDAVAEALGDEAAYGEELHHRTEHSIELAAVWLHFTRKGQPVPLVPILCGSFAEFVAGKADPATHVPFSLATGILKEVIAARRTLVVAAADLAHMGPAFGDPYGLDFVGRAQLRNADERLLETIVAGDADAFFQELKQEGDRRHVCGLPPIYLTLRLLGETGGELVGYDLCPADPQGTSLVSIAGVILR